MAKTKKPDTKYKITTDGRKMAKNKSVSKKTQETVMNLQNKFTQPSKNIVKDNKTATKESNKVKNVNADNKTASKIKPLLQSNDFVDILSKIYSFMNKNYEEDKLHREKMENFKEENEIEARKRHEKLLEAIKKLTKVDDKEDTATKDDQSGGSIIDSILGAFGGVRLAISALSLLGGFVASPVGVALLAAVAAGTVGKWMWEQIKADPETALKGKGGVRMAVAGLGSEGQLPSYEEEQSNKSLEAKAKAVDKKGLKSATLEELEAKKQLLMDYGKAKSPEVAEIIKEIASRKSGNVASGSTATPVASGSQSAGGETSTNAAAPVPSAPASSQLNSVQSENNNAKIESMAEPAKSTINTVNTTRATDSSNIPQRSSIPPVRNLEETFQKMIIYSTRVV
jgi:hypothetical protein